jgi:hypothetical protein
LAVALAAVIIGAVIGLLWPIASNRGAAICNDMAAGDNWMERACLRSEEIDDMLNQARLADDPHCVDAQKAALIRMVRTGEARPLETNQKFPKGNQVVTHSDELTLGKRHHAWILRLEK